MSQSLGEAPFNFMICLEKLMGEVLGHESKHQIGSLRVWPKFPSLKKSLSQQFGIGKNSFACRKRHMKNSSRTEFSMYSCVAPTFSSHGQRTVFRYRREEPGVVGDVVVRLPVEVSIYGIVSRWTGNFVTSNYEGR